MDKYEFNIKVEQIKKMVAKGDYETAMKIADTIDWRRVRNINILSMVATVYEKNEEYQEAKDILLLALERAPIGKRLLYKLAELAVKEGSIKEAEDYYREFCDIAQDDPGQYILRYMILKAKGAPVEQLIHTLEQYCNIELDEKWLYELAELYNKAGMSELCVMACDKLMLMFGLGKYVDKAMELKLQHAPLTGYQMDLVENRDKYEAKLREVEQEYSQPEPYIRTIPQPVRQNPVREEELSREEAYTRQPQYTREAQMEEMQEPDEVQPVHEDITIEPDDGRENYAEAESVEEKTEPEPEMELTEESEPEEEARPVRMVSPVREVPPMREVPPVRRPELVRRPETDSMAKSRLHEVRAQENLAKEMSRISSIPDKEPEPEAEEMAAQTRVLADIRELNREPSYRGSNHLMIEAAKPDEGFELAVEALKKIHKETGAKNQVAKITGEKLNRRGIFTISDKLIGRDLIIEQAGDMNDEILQELNQLMARDETGMNIVLIDTPDRLEELHRVYPGLAKRFECIGTSQAVKAVKRAGENAARAMKPEKMPEQEAEPKRQEARQVKVPVRNTSVSQNRPKAESEAENAGEPEPRVKVTAAERRAPERAAEAPKAEAEREMPKRRASEHRAAEQRSEYRVPERAAESEQPRRKAQARPQAEPETPAKTADGRPVRRVQPTGDNHPALKQPAPKVTVRSASSQREEDADYEEEMDIDDFAKYACQYAGDIDCSISGKSMLALYERIEMMEEDGVPLTRANAEDLIEEAADRAEKPSFIRRITGIFSSKYDKDGLLILKEEHFI